MQYRTLLMLAFAMTWLSVAFNAPALAATAAAPKVRTLSWDDLLPESERNAPPTNLAAMRNSRFTGTDDFLPAQTGSTAVNKQLAGQLVKLPGYVVPLDVSNNKVRRFFLVPYYGACIHVPPPPPNQMVYVELPQAIPINRLYEAQWVTGQMVLETHSNQLATATYTIKASGVDAYREP